MVNVAGLSIELTAAGIAHGGCHSDGRVWDVTNVEIQNRPDVAAVIAAHNPAVWEQRGQRVDARALQARSTAKTIPSWATWTQAEWQTYFNANLSDAEVDKVTSLAIAREGMKRQNLVIQKLGQMLLAMRDQIWPDLPE